MGNSKSKAKGNDVVSMDLEQTNRIIAIDVELETSTREIKRLSDIRKGLIEDLPEYQALEAAVMAVRECRERLRLAIRDNRELAKVEVDTAEERFKLRDLREILSHHLVVYTQDTGRDVVKDHEAHTRQIELKAKLGKRALDQARLPLGINKHLGQHVEIPTGLRVEVKPGEEL
jgi:hypothetical protein